MFWCCSCWNFVLIFWCAQVAQNLGALIWILEFNIPALFVSFLCNHMVGCDYFGCGGTLKRKEVGLQFWIILCRPKKVQTQIRDRVYGDDFG
jgi:hypothetical protein